MKENRGVVQKQKREQDGSAGKKRRASMNPGRRRRASMQGSEYCIEKMEEGKNSLGGEAGGSGGIRFIKEVSLS